MFILSFQHTLKVRGEIFYAYFRSWKYKKYYSDRLIIEFDELKIYSGDKIGIVGQNGSGKTTLMNILSKETEADQGFVKQNCDLAYIRQFSDESMEASVKALLGFVCK